MARGRPRIEAALCIFYYLWLLLLGRLSTVDSQLCAVPGSSVGGAHELHFDHAFRQCVRNFRPAGEEGFNRAAFQRELVSLKKRKLDILSGPGRTGQRSSGRGRSGRFGGRSTFSRSRRGLGSGRRLGSGSGFRSRSSCGGGCFLLIHFLVKRGGSTTVAFGGGGGTATGHNGDHDEAQQAQKNLAHLFTLSYFLLSLYTRIPSVRVNRITLEK